MQKREVKGLIELYPNYAPVKLKYKDIFDIKEFYMSLQEWLLEHDWSDEEDKVDHWETYYGERVSQDGSKEIWFQWRAAKNAPGSIKLKYYLDLDFHVLGLGSAEIVKEGRKMKVNKGEIEMAIKPGMELLYLKEFEKSPLLKQFKNLFEKRIYRETIEQRKKELYQETYEFQNYIKHWFKMKRYLPYKETRTFFPSQAWPSHLKEE